MDKEASEKTNQIEIYDKKIEDKKLDDKDIIKISPKLRSIFFHIIALICITIFSICIAPKSLQNDTFYTITIGKYIAENGISDLTQDMYSWHELPYTYPHWLYDLGMYMIFKYFDHPGIYMSTIVFSVILGMSVYALCFKKSKNNVLSFAATIGAMYLVKSYMAARAQLVTFILFTWTVYFIEKFLETKKIRYALPLIIIPLLITNLHCAVFPFYFVLFLPYIGEYITVAFVDFDLDVRLYKIFLKLFRKIRRKEEAKTKITEKLEKLDKYYNLRKEGRVKLRNNPYKIKVEKNHIVLLLISIMFIALCTGMLNPAGDGAYTYLWKTMKGNTTGSINEHLPLTLVENTEFATTIILFLMVLIFTDTKIKLHDLFMLSGLTYLAFKQRRQVSMYTLFCIPILTSMIAEFVKKYDSDITKKIEKFIADWFGCVVIICSFIIWGTHLIKPIMHDDYIDISSYPIQASEWMLKNLDVDNIKLYNEYNYGSYLLHKGIPVFIDSRCDLYTPEFNGVYNKETKRYEGRDIFSDALNIASLSTNYVDMFNNYGVTHVILYEDNKLAMVLESDANYELLYDDSYFKIFKKLDAEKVQEQKTKEVEKVLEEKLQENVSDSI